MRNYFILASMAAFAMMSFSCSKENVDVGILSEAEETPVTTKSYGDKTPKVVVYVETNDVNPLNAGDYYLANGSQFVDIVELFAANIHADDNGDPCLYLNDKLTPVLENGGAATYVAPLQAKGIKVLLTVLGDWAGVGVANMTDTQAEQFASILAYAVEKYGLDGIGFDDEYANYSGSLVSGSFGNLITKLHAKLASDKLITVFEYGNYDQISSTTGALIDYAYTNFSYWNSSSSISGVTNSRWAPCAFNLGSSYSAYNRNRMTTYASNAASGGYGAIMFFNLRSTSDVSPLPVFNAIASGAFSSSVTVSGGNHSRDAGSVSGGFTITYDSDLM